ncbi:hypothetical protein ABZZ37_20460 [Streptomyces sp. NPDC006464]|uniref:hypothetical protein n=1 Tax=unclassified Streptomyces TaxID=2593676 RepID=UPI0033A14121
MEPLAAGAVAALIARYAEHLAAGPPDPDLTERLGGLWDAVAARFQGDPVAEGALRRLRDQPENTDRRCAVEDHVQELADGDPEFGAALAGLLERAGRPASTYRPRIPAARPSIENG